MTLAILLTFGMVGQVKKIFDILFGFIKIFQGTLDDYQTGWVLGSFISWVVYFTITILLYQNGLKWTRKTVTGKSKNIAEKGR